MMKKFLSLLLACLMVLCPLLARADQTLGFTLAVELDPSQMKAEHQSMAQGLKAGLDVISFAGDVTYNEDWKFHMDADMLVNGTPYVDALIRSNSQWISINSNVFGDVRIALMMQVYLEFAMKPYHFMGLSTQYPALLTSRYAHTSAWDPVVEMCARVIGTEGSRTVSTQDLVALAEEIALYSDESREMRYWIMALLMDVGSDYILTEMLYTLPQWVEEAAGEEGLVIEVTEAGEEWTLGGKPLFSLKQQEGGYYDAALALERDGYTVAASGSFKQGGELTALIDIQLEEEEGAQAQVFRLEMKGDGLPDGQAASQPRLQIAMSGYMLPEPMTFVICGQWDTAPDGTVNASLSWLNNATGQPRITLRGSLTPKETQEGLLTFTNRDLEKGAVNVFTLGDITLKEFIDSIKGSAMMTGIPLALALPGEFINTVLDFLTEAGFMDMILPS